MKPGHRGPTVLVLMLLAAVWSSAGADRVHLVNGGVLTGEIVTSDSTRLTIRTEGGEVRIERDRVVRVERESTSAILVHKGYLDLVAGKVSEGLASWKESLSSGDPKAAEALNGLLEERGDALQSALRTLEESARPRAIEDLATLAEYPVLSPDARFACVEGLVDLGAEERAVEVLLGPTGRALADSGAARAYLIQFWRGRIRRKLAAREYGRALAAIDQLQVLDEGAGRPQRALWLLARIGEARDRGDVLEALRLAVEDLLPLLPEVADNRIGLLLNELPGWAADPDAPPARFDQAREFLETRLASVMPSAARQALEDVVAEKGRVLLSQGRTTETLTLVHSLPQLRSSERIRVLGLHAEYQRRLLEVSDGEDPLALYRLGEWAADQGRTDWALDIFKKCLDRPAVSSLAEMQIQMLRNRVESKALEESVRLYRQNRLFDALEALDPILKQEKGEEPSAFQEDAMRMAELIRIELRVESDKRPYQAEILYQQAERAFFVGDYPGAIQNLAEVLRQYGDTPAAQRADALLPQVLRTMQLERMEGHERPLPDIPPDLRERAAAGDESLLDQEIRSLLDALTQSESNPPGGGLKER